MSNIIKFQLPCQFQRFFIPNLVHVLTNKRNYIERNFYSVAWFMPQGWDLGVLGVKTLAWGFEMAPHRLRILVHFVLKNVYEQILCFYLLSGLSC